MKNSSGARGFTLIELLISVAIALIVTGSAIALMVSIMQANGQNIASTRLTQELRAVAEVVARDVKRARYMEDAISFVGERNDDDNGDGVVDALDYVPVNPFDAVTVDADPAADDGAGADGVATDVDGTCIHYSYEKAEATGALPAGRPFRAIHRAVDGAGIGAVFVARDRAADPGCVPETRLSSAEVNISMLAFNFNTTDDWLRITVAGNLVRDPTITRQVSTSIRLRSQAVP